MALTAVAAAMWSPTVANRPAQSGGSVTAAATPPTVAYTFSDFFTEPYGEWWDWRLGVYGDRAIGADCFNASSIKDGICTKDWNGDGKLTAEAGPQYMNWYPSPIVTSPAHPNPTIYAPYRMNVVASNIPNYTITKPVMLPLCTDLVAAYKTYPACPTTLPAGTSATMVWDFNYLDMSAAKWADTTCGTSTVAAEDGFISMSNITLTLDLATASRIFGSPTSSVSAAQSWWSTNGDSVCGLRHAVSNGVQSWLAAQGGLSTTAGPYDIYSAYQYFYSPFQTYTVASVASNGVTTVKILHITWGAEALLARWFFWGPALYSGNYTDPTKAQGWYGMELPWFENMHMTATIGTTMSLTLNSVMQYSLQQGGTAGPDQTWGTSDDGSTWFWQAILADYIQPANGQHPWSELSLYSANTYLHTQCGSLNYGTQFSYDFRPQNWKVKTGESLVFKFPTGNIPYCDPFASPHDGQTGASDPNTLVFHNGLATLMDTVPASVGSYDASTNTLTLTGPVSNGFDPIKPLEGIPTVEWSQPALLRATTNPAVSGKIFLDGVPMDEWGTVWAKVQPGTHTVSFGGLNGLAPPAPQTVTLTPGQTTTVQGNYVVEGFLRVITNPALPSTISVGGTPRDDWGMWTALAPGTYTVHFGAVAGFNPPADQSAIVTAGATTTITGNFVANSGAPGPDPSTFGYLRVTTNPASAVQILANGIPMDDWGLTWVKLAPGSYTISFADAYGLTPPAPATFVVTAGATTTYNAAFTVHGSLRVTTSPALPATIYVNGAARDDWGMWQSIAPGTYTVAFGAVPGFVTPAAQSVTVTSGALASVTGTYVAAAGVILAPAPAVAQVASPAPAATAAPAAPAAFMLAAPQATVTRFGL